MLLSLSKGHFMSTAAQTLANQANSQHSTGPRTLEGKARVVQNAVRHGLTAKHLVIRDDEKEEFRALHAWKLDKKDAANVPAITDINELTKLTQSEVGAKAMELALQYVDFEASVLTRNALREKSTPSRNSAGPQAGQHAKTPAAA